MKTYSFKKKVLLTGLVLSISALTAFGQTNAVTIASFGGNLQKDLSKTLWQPAAQMVNLSLREESHGGGLAQLRLQVQSGKPGWDVVHLGGAECASATAEGLTERLDYSIIKTDGIPEGMRDPNWIAQNTYSVVLAWRTDKYKDNPPKNWQDFWNVKSFPGRRALSTEPSEMLEVALLGDGVSKDKLYPLDVKRGLASLSKIKKDISVWWKTGAQSTQLIQDGEVDMMAIYGSRVFAAVNSGAPVAYTYQDGLLGVGCLAVVKGSKKIKESMQFINAIISPETQSRIPTMMGYYGPSNSNAYKFANLSADALEKSNMSPTNQAKQAIIQSNWWRDHLKEVNEPYLRIIAN